MGSQANDVASAANASQRVAAVPSHDKKGERQSQVRDPYSSPEPRRLRRNPLFSETSQLVVLRDDNPLPLADSSKKSEKNERDPFIPRDWGSLPLERGLWVDAETAGHRSKHMPFHDGIQQEFESRSYFHTRRNIPLILPAKPNYRETSLPSFFHESFPSARERQHETDLPLSLHTSHGSTQPVAQSAKKKHQDFSVASATLQPDTTFPTHSSSTSLTSLSPGVSLPPSRRSSCDTLEPNSATPPSGQPEIFAKEVRVRGWQRIGSYARGWVAFDVVVTAKSVRKKTNTGCCSPIL